MDDVKDSNGNILKDGDSVHVIKDLKVKGAGETLKRGTLIKNIRLAEGGRTILYKKLEADGRVATHGILFDSGSDVIRPESTPTLEEIGKMLQKYTDLNLLIEGHTDSQGDDAFNQTLSEKRAAAVKQYLCQEYEMK